jgi:hypothetical protein
MTGLSRPIWHSARLGESIRNTTTNVICGFRSTEVRNERIACETNSWKRTNLATIKRFEPFVGSDTRAKDREEIIGGEAMNIEKHKKKVFQESVEEDTSLVPTRARGSHILTRYIKIPKPISQKRRPNFLNQATLKEKALPRGGPGLRVRFHQKKVVSARRLRRPTRH